MFEERVDSSDIRRAGASRRKVDAMTKANLLSRLAVDAVAPQIVAEAVTRKPEMLPELFAGLGERSARIKFGCAKVLLLVSERSPATLSPHAGRLVALLDSGNKIPQWSAILALGNLAAVTPKKSLERILVKYLAPIRGPVMVTAANVMKGAAKIALAKPEFADAIARAILQVEQARYSTRECRNVAVGHAIKALDQFFAHVQRKEPVIKMVRRQLKNSRNATRRKAKEFLRRHTVDVA
jgi:hypothetical protein